MTLYLKLLKSWLQLFPTRAKQKFLAEIAVAEGLDEFVKLENQKAEVVEYTTVHGCRICSSDRPGLNMFVVLKKGNGFIPARSLPYVYRNSSPGWGKCPQLVVACSPTDAATQAGYSRAVPLPYKYLPNPESTFSWLASDLRSIPAAVYAAYAKAAQSPDEVYSRFHSTCCFIVCIPNSLEVCINIHNEEAIEAGYANAVPIAVLKSNVYIEDLNMLDIDYAASLVEPRIG